MHTPTWDKPEIEYLDGAPHPKMSPRTRHSLVQAALWQIIARCAGTRGFAGTEWRFRLGHSRERGTLFVPDVAFVSTERLRSLPANERDEPTVSPDIAVEVRSPRDNLAYLHQKIARYLECGAALVLDVDPLRRTIDAHGARGVWSFRETYRFTHEAEPWLIFDLTEAFATLEVFERL